MKAKKIIVVIICFVLLFALLLRKVLEAGINLILDNL